MYIKKYLIGYILLAIGMPSTIFLANMVGTSMLKGVAAAILVLCAIVNFMYSGKIINYIFGNRGHNKVDLGFVLLVNLGVILLYFIRYTASCLLAFEQIPKFLIYIVMSPFIILIASPFMKNYCLNVNTIRTAIVTAAILMFFVIPAVIMVMDRIVPGNNFILQSVYNKYFMYESAANVWVMNILEAFKITLSDKMLLIVINAMSFMMWCLTFLPYVVINCVITDELTYMEFCKKLSALNIMTICATIVGIAVVCCILADSGRIDILYSLKHY